MESILVVAAPYAFVVLFVIVMLALAFSKPAVFKLEEKPADLAARQEAFKDAMSDAVNEAVNEAAPKTDKQSA